MPGVIIIGGGISGLSAAYYLAKAGREATLIESRPRLGGVIQTEHVEGCTIEAGPDSFLSVKPAAFDLIREIGLGDQIIGSNDHLRVTFVRKNGRLVPLPDGLMMMVPTKILPLVTTSLIGWGTKLRMGMELFRAPQPQPGDESVAQFVEEHYGREAVDYLAEPLLSGIYGGNVERLSVRSVLPRFVELANQYGSLTRGVLAMRAKAKPSGPAPPLFRTLRGGLGQMVDAVRSAIGGKVSVVQGRAEIVERRAGRYAVRIGEDWIEAEHIVVATEAHSAGNLLVNVDGRLSDLLGTVEYGSSITIALGFDDRDFADPPVGFGFLVPKKERRALMACTWVGTKFSNRVPDGKTVARCFMGGLDESAFTRSDDQIVSAVADDLREIAGVTARPRFSRVYRWPRAMAQYPVGHPTVAAEIESRVATLPGLHLAGNAYDGIGIPDCIRLGKRAAERIAKG
jgi:oxygen-dependent protoporphyrinogen oxidase